MSGPYVNSALRNLLRPLASGMRQYANKYPKFQRLVTHFGQANRESEMERIKEFAKSFVVIAMVSVGVANYDSDGQKFKEELYERIKKLTDAESDEQKCLKEFREEMRELLDMTREFNEEIRKLKEESEEVN